MRCLNPFVSVILKVTSIYITQKNLQPNDTYSREVETFMYIINLSYQLHLTIISNSSQMFIRVMQDKLNLSNFHHQKHVKTHVQKC